MGVTGRRRLGRRVSACGRSCLVLAVLLWLALGTEAGTAAGRPAAASTEASAGAAPPEWAGNAGSWPSHNYDLANTRATARSPITSRNVSRLRVAWRVPFQGSGLFGVYASNPIVLDGTVYLQDLGSNVYALDRDSGRLRWRRTFDRQSVGPNGVAYGWCLLFAATDTSVLALDPRTGQTVWSRVLVRNNHEGIDIAPQLYDGTVVVSTVAGNLNTVSSAGAMGIVWALDAQTGEPKWQFNTVKDGDLWGNPEINSGGGLWYPPAVDGSGRVFLAVANPVPFPGTPEFPNGSSRPGPNLYTSSLVAVDGRTGRLLWYRQAVPHDLRDYDLQDSPIVTTVTVGGVPTEIVLTAGKMGTVYAFRADDGQQLWQRSVGRHQNDVGPLPDQMVTVFPGLLGGVETPMALAGGRVLAPWVDFGTDISSTAYGNPVANIDQARGGLAAVDAASGTVLWQRALPQMPLGAATVANDVVFTSTYDGTIFAFEVSTGRTLWTATARAGINSFPAVDGDTLLVGAGTAGFFANAVYELIAYRLG